jgi:hypothetical protein
VTGEQKDIFISVSRMGVACGLYHPYEWIVNYELHAPQLMPYDRVDEHLRMVRRAFLEFFHGCGSCPEDPIETWTIDEMLDSIDEFYRRRRNGQP